MRLISLQFAIRGMTGLAASLFGVQDRGLIREGQKADIVVLDEARIRDHATYTAPHNYSEGTGPGSSKVSLLSATANPLECAPGAPYHDPTRDDLAQT